MTITKVSKSSSDRQAAHLKRLADSGGKPVRVDLSKDDLAKVDDLVANGYAPTRVEAIRRAIREVSFVKKTVDGV